MKIKTLILQILGLKYLSDIQEEMSTKLLGKSQALRRGQHFRNKFKTNY